MALICKCFLREFTVGYIREGMKNMTNRNRKLVKEKDKDKKDVISKIDGAIEKIEPILFVITLIWTAILDVVYIYILPKGIRKNIVIFYLTALFLLSLQLLCSKIFKRIKFIPNFWDSTWLSYITFVIILVPIIVIAIHGYIVQWDSEMDVELLLQTIYWSIAGSNFIWFLLHLLLAKESEQRKKLNLFLKLMVVIISGIGLVMDIVAQINFTYQFLAIAWTVLLMSYISDRIALCDFNENKKL